MMMRRSRNRIPAEQTPGLVSLSVCASDVGRIIGKKGARIRELEQNTGAQIKIYNTDSGSCYSTVEIKGNGESQLEAKRLIEEILGSSHSVGRLSNLVDGVHMSSNQRNFRSRTSHNDGQAESWVDASSSNNWFKNSSQLSGSGSSNRRSQNSRSWTDRKYTDKDDMCNENWNSKPPDQWSVNSQHQPALQSFVTETADDWDADYTQSINAWKSSKYATSETWAENCVDATDDPFADYRLKQNHWSDSQKKGAKGSLVWALSNAGINCEAQEEEESGSVDFALLRREREAYKAQKFQGLPPIKKDFYIENSNVKNMSIEEVKNWRKLNNNVQVFSLHGENCKIPNPVRTFTEAFEHYPEILREIKKQGFSSPTPIQTQAWPILMQGLDLIGIAQTGTGKTLAFLLPALIHLEGQVIPRNEREGPSVLVLCPTRELALQIEAEVKKIKYRRIKCVCLYGGGNRREQINVVTKGVDIVVATPGRLNDLRKNELISLRSITYLVLDEADRMLDLGFEPQIKLSLMDVRPDRQTVMTSATWPPAVEDMAKRYLENPIQVCVGSLDLTACHAVRQEVEIITEEEKKDRLIYFIQKEMDPNDKVIVFVGRKITADDITSDLVLSGIICRCIHGDREQYDREQSLHDFKTGLSKILIATDVASRGLDVKDITHVFNYDFPRNVEEYVHRIGRTGRAGKSGTSITLVTRDDWKSAKQLIEIMQEANQEVPYNLITMAERFEAHQKKMTAEGRTGRGRRGRFGGRHY